MFAFQWKKNFDNAGFKAEMPDNVTLWVVPTKYAKGFDLKPARGAKWRAGCNYFDGKFTVSRFGRDAYDDLQDSAKKAMRLAEEIYREALDGIFGNHEPL